MRRTLTSLKRQEAQIRALQEVTPQGAAWGQPLCAGSRTRWAPEQGSPLRPVRKVLAVKQVLTPELPKVAAGEPSLAAHLYTSALNNSAKERFFGAI